jgi:negative regulator of replication initiation
MSRETSRKVADSRGVGEQAKDILRRSFERHASEADGSEAARRGTQQEQVTLRETRKQRAMKFWQ